MKDRYIIVDSREKPKAITRILEYFEKHQIKHVSSKLLFGDYMDYNRPDLVIDRKQNIAELAKNCTREHERFKAEMLRAQDAGAQLVILVEQNSYSDRGEKVYVEGISDLMRWSSPNTVVTGEKIFRVLSSWCAKYPIRVEFCSKGSTGKRIVEILYGKEGDGNNER